MESLNLKQQNYVEDMGLFYEQNGSQRTMGKVIGLLLIAGEILPQDDLMRLLNLSRTSVSSALRWAEHLGFVEQVTLPGNRKRYYQIQPQMATWLARSSFHELQEFMQLLATAEELAEPGAQEQLSTMHELLHFLNERIQAALAEWQARNC